MASNLARRTLIGGWRKLHDRTMPSKRVCRLTEIASCAPPSFSTTTSSRKMLTLDEMEDVLNRPTEKSTVEAKKSALKMEYDYFAYMGNSVPQVITDEMYDKVSVRTNFQCVRFD